MTAQPQYVITEYAGGHDAAIADLILSIQNGEAGLPLTVEQQPDLLDIVKAYSNGGFWVAWESVPRIQPALLAGATSSTAAAQDPAEAATLETGTKTVLHAPQESSAAAAPSGRIIGTIGLMCYRNRVPEAAPIGTMKKFFVHKDYRGAHGPARELYMCLHKRAIELRLPYVILDTPNIAHRAHAFYERMGWRVTGTDELPQGYGYVVPGAIVYRLDLLEEGANKSETGTRIQETR